MKKKLCIIILAVVSMLCLCFGSVACAKEGHTHTYDTAWTYDADYHWHKATCGHTTQTSGKASHTFVDNVCSVCGYEKNTENPDNPSDKYTVVFDSNEGSFSDSYTIELTVDANSLLTVPEEPIRKGYVFVGWSKNVNGTQLWDFANDRVTNNITIYAVWLQEFTITFDANGGKFSDDKGTFDLVLCFGEKISAVETPERTGFSFVGWYTNSNLTDLWDFENGTISSSITLYAGWKADIQEHDVTFVLNYSGAEDVVRSTENGLITYKPSRAGYVFNGWWYSDGQTDEGYILSRKFDTSEIVTEDNLVLYAEWVEESTVSSQLEAPIVSINQRVFYWVAVSGATGYNIRVYKSGSNEELVNETIRGTSWTFPSGYDAGYYNVRIRANGDGINNVNSSYVSKSYAHNILSTIANISFDISTSVLTWTAVKDATEYDLYINNQLIETLEYTMYDLSDYEAGTYTIKIISKRSGYQSSTTTELIEKKRLKTPSGVRTFVDSESNGYTIIWDAVAYADTYILMIGDREIRLTDTSYVISSSSGYWVEQSLTFTLQAFDSSADYLISIASDEVMLGKIYSFTTEANIEGIGEIGINGEIYVPQEYVVAFNLNGASGSVPSQTVTSSEGLKYPAIPTRSNYVFRGWYVDAACSQLYDFTAPVTQNITLYAGWHYITTSGYSTYTIDITSNYNTSSSAYSASNRYATSSSNANYIYFRALTSGSYTFYYRNGSSASLNYGTYFLVYNVTKGTVILSNTSTYYTTYYSKTFTADAGDVFYIRAYKYSSSTSYYTNYYFYITGATLPAAGGKVIGGDYMEADKSDLSNVLVSYGAELSITAVTKDNRYIFAGWYNGETLLTEERTYIFAMPAEDVSYTAKWIYYSVTTEKNMDEAGSITLYDDSPIEVGDIVTLTATTNNGYTWLGWYDGDTHLTDELTYTFTMAEHSVRYTAKWMVCPVILEKSIDEAGSVMGVSGATKAGAETTVTASTNEGYTWLGWYNGDLELTKELSYTFTMPTESMTLTAKWTYFTVTTNTNEANGGSYTVLNAVKTTTGSDVTIVASTNSGYMWMGWYNGETLISSALSYTFAMPAENVVYTAKWMASPVTLEKNIEEAGSVSGMGNTTVVGEEITVTATTNEGYTWLGWYNGNTELSKELTYTFIMPTENITYTAKWTFYTLTTEVSDSSAGSITNYTNEKITAGTSVTVLAATNPGYTFLGWFNGDVELTENLSYTFEMPTESIVYTAKWTFYTLTVNKTDGGTVNSIASSVTVSFDLNGASGEAPDSQIITQTNGLTYPEIPTRSNYVFAGWYDNAACSGSTFDFSAAISNDITLYAKWIAYEGAGVISINEHITLSVGSKNSTGSYKYYAFVPLVSGSITIYTTGSLDTYGFLYNSSKVQLKTNDDDGDGNNFKITYNVTAGTLYYIVACGYNSSGSTTLYLTGSIPEAGGILSAEYGEFTAPIKVTAGHSITLYADTNEGYTFLGWYNGENRVSADLNFSFVMAEENVVYTAKWQLCAVVLAKNIDEAGSVSGVEGATRLGEHVTIEATTNSGYTFLGWYNGDALLTREESYTFVMTENAITYTAKWTYYTVTTTANDPDAGTYTIKEEENVTAGESVTLVATVNEGYTWLGWYNGSEILTDELSYTFEMPAESIIYTAKWTYYTLTTVTNNSSAGTFTEKTAEKVTAGTSLTLTATVNAGYTWLGWYDGTEKLTEELNYTFEMPSESVTYTAKYEIYTLTVNSTDGGTIGMMSAKVSFNLNGATGTAPATQIVTDEVGLVYPNIPTRSGYLFTGWYKEEECRNLFDFASDITRDITLYAGWYSCSDNRSMEIGQYTSSSPLAISMSGTSSTEPVYVYFRALRTGSYTFGYKNSSSSSSYMTYFYIYDVTAGTVLSANTSVTSTSFATKSLALTEGHVYYIRLYRYSLNYTPTFSIYLSGTLKPTAGGKTTGNTEVNNYMISAGESVTLAAATQAGYTFLGWYNNEQLLSTELTYIFDMPASNVEYTAKWIQCPVTITVNNENAGNVSELPSTTIAGQKVTVTATTKAGYTFLGWYNGDQLLSAELNYTFAMPSVITTITAKWIACPVTIEVNDFEAGSTSALPSTTIAGKDVTVIATTNNGYTFLGWYEGERLITTELSYTFAMPSSAATYTAKWMECPVEIDKNIDEAGSVSGVEGATRVGEQVTIVAATNSGYTFLGWYSGEDCLTTSESYSFEMTSDNVKYTAKWTYYTLTLNGTEGGTIGNRVTFNLNGGKGEVPETQIITTSTGLVYPDIPSRSGFLFTGWYTESSCVNLFDFSETLTSDITLYAGWFAVGNNASIEINQYTSASPFSFSTSGSTSSAPKYTYFRALTTGTYTFGYKNGTTSLTSYATYLYIYDVTAGTSLRSNNYVSNTSWSTLNLSLTAGHTYYIRTYMYGNYSTTFSLYLSGDLKPAAGGLSESIESNKATKITAGEEVTITATTKDGYIWLGWFDGEDKLTDQLTYTFEMPAENISYTAKWTSYSLTVDKTEGGSVEKFYGAAVVMFDLNGGDGSISSQTITYESGLSYPSTIPTRSGYIFTGWYSDEDCTALYDFTQNIDRDITLYAGWYRLSGNVIEINEYNSSSPYSISTANTSSANPAYTYFRTLSSGQYTFGYKNGNSSTYYGTYLYVYDVTTSRVIKANTAVTSTSFVTEKYSLEAGHVYYVRIYRYNTSYSTTFSMYIQGTLLPNDGGICGSLEANTERVLPGHRVTLIASTDRNYTFLGWYDGDQLITNELEYTFVMPEANIAYTAKWAGYTVTVTPTEGGEAERVFKHTVELDENYTGGSITQQIVLANSGLKYTVPTREGYIFTGWYTESSCKNLYDFTSTLYENITLYAGWVAYTTGTFVEINSYSESSPFVMTTNGTSSSNYGYIRFRALVSGEYNFGYKLDSAYSTYLYIYDATAGTALKSNSSVSNTTWATLDLNLTAGHVYYARIYRYSTSSYTNFSMYLTGIKTPADGGMSDADDKVAAGDTVTIQATTKAGYTWLGWYLDDEFVSDDFTYTFVMPNRSVVYEARWTCYTITTNTNAEGGGTFTRLDGQKVADGDSVTLTASLNDGYTWLGWYEGDNLLSDDMTYTFTMGTEDLIITAKYGFEEVTLYYVVDGEVIYSEKMTFESSLESLYNYNADDKNFSGWYADSACNSEMDKVLDTTKLKADTENKVYVFGATYAGTANLTFTKVGEEYSVTGYNGDETAVVLPNQYNGMPVTKIADRAFYANDSLYRITVSDSVKQIGADAFYQCYRLAEIDNLSDLEITVGSSDNGYIAYYATKVYKTEENNGERIITDSDGYVFYFDGTKYYLIDYNGSGTELLLPEKINDSSYEIAPYAFYGKNAITSIKLLSGITKIGEYAFSNCSSLTTVEFGENISSIAETAYYMCANLRTLILAEGNEYFTCIDNNLIEKSTTTLILGCSDNIPNDGSVTKIGMYAFAWRNNIEDITINSYITEVKAYAFYECNGLTSLTILSGISKIGEYAFYGASFNAINVPTSVISVGYAAFGGNGNITTMTLPFVGGEVSSSAASESTLFGYIFGKDNYNNSLRTTQYYGASNSVVYYIPAGLTTITITGGSILYGGFYGCSKLTNVNVSVSEIGDRAFYNCYGITALSISSTRTIGEYAFANCFKLTAISVPSTVTSIGSAALFGCYGLTEIIIPFVGSNSSASTASAETLFGFIFGETEYSNSIAVQQRYSNLSSCSVTYYLPKNLASVQVLRGNLLFGAFYGCTMLENVILNAVTSIGDYAFYNCDVLSEITIPYSTTTIGSYAFANCEALTKVIIGSGVTAIGTYAFQGCTALKDVTLGNNVSSIGMSAFSGCSALEEITIPNKVTQISTSMFSGCISLSQVTMQGNVTSIGASAFYNCNALESISIPGTVQQIGDSAFANSALTSLALPSSLTSSGLGNMIISGCVNLTTLTISGSSIYKSVNNCIIRNYSVVLGCAGSTIPTSSSTATSIGGYAFYGCNGISSITIPSNITSIGSYAFATSDLTRITIPSGVLSVGEYAFYDCNSLISAVFSGSTTTIGKYAFKDCALLSGITLPTNLTSISEGLFYGCLKLNSISIPNTVTSIGSNAFYSCRALTTVVVPTKVTTIGAGAFSGCTGLTSISVPFVGGSSGASTASASTLFGYIFGTYRFGTGVAATTQSYSESGSVTYYIPTSLKTVTLTTDCKLLYGAFHNCSNISAVNLYSSSTITNIPAYAFYNTGITAIDIPTGVTSIANTSFRNCSKLTSISIPNGVTSLGEGTLSGCGSLTSVTLPFVGASATQNSRSAGYPFGYIFGTSSFTGASATSQTYYSVQYTMTKSTTTYYIPKSLKSVTILNYTSGYWGSSDGESNKYIIYGAFYGCSNLTSVTLPSEANYIFQYAFYECSSLTGINIPSGVTNIGDYAFYNCSSLSSVTFGSTKNLERIGMYAFKKCTNLASISLPTSLTTLQTDCFSETGLTSITIPSNVESSYSGTWFTNCKSLKTVKYSGSKVTYIGGYSGCSALTSINIPTSVTGIVSEAFYGCSALTSITIPAAVTSIGNNAFEGCTSLKTVTFTSNSSSSSSKLTSIGTRAFYGCSALTSIIIPVNVTSINSYAFYGCTSLTSATFRTTSGWRAGSYSVTLTNTATNAKYLASDYASSSWSRS